MAEREIVFSKSAGQRCVILQRFPVSSPLVENQMVNSTLGSVDLGTGNFCPPDLMSKIARLQEYSGYLISEDTQSVLTQALNGVANVSKL